jgi:hypothetical protein
VRVNVDRFFGTIYGETVETEQLLLAFYRRKAQSALGPEADSAPSALWLGETRPSSKTFRAWNHSVTSGPDGEVYWIVKFMGAEVAAAVPPLP